MLQERPGKSVPTRVETIAQMHIPPEVFESVGAFVPSLRYIAFADRGTRPPEPTAICDWAEDMLYEDHAGTRAPWRWWRLVRDDEDESVVVEAREIPAWEGERVRAFLRNASVETAQAFDGTCSLDRFAARLRS